MPSTPRQKVLWTIAILVVVLYALIPVAWIASLSFKSSTTIGDKHFFPQSISFDNYKTLFQTDEFNRALINSIGIAHVSTLIAVVLASMAAYALSRLERAGPAWMRILSLSRLDFRGKPLFMSGSLAAAIFPWTFVVGSGPEL